MADMSIVGPDGGESIQLGPTRMRILEDGSTTSHRLGIGEIALAPHTDGPPQHRHARHDEGERPEDEAAGGPSRKQPKKIYRY